MAALRRAGTEVYEPLNRFRLDVPEVSFSSLAPVLARLRAVLHMQELHGSSYVLEGEIPAARIHELQQQLSGITRGEGRSSPRSSAMRPCKALRRLARAPTAIR